MRLHTSRGLVAALIIILLWAVSLATALSLPFRGALYFLAIPLVPIVMFLYTGLFITAHDAMHGVVVPGNRRLNNLIGSFCSIAYALFSFERLKTQHWKHHREPDSGYEDSHHARSSEYSEFISFLTCYHFGYHHEHHEYPNAPWWHLPSIRREVMAQ